MKNWRLVVACVCGPYVVGLTWGYFRLPWAALKSMSEYHTFANAPVVTLENMDVSPAQQWHLDRCLSPSPIRVVPRLSVQVTASLD